MIFIVLLSVARSHVRGFTLGPLTESLHQVQTCPLSSPVGCYRPNIHPSPCISTRPWGWHSFTVPRRVEGWVNQDSAVSVQPVCKAAYRSDFCEKHGKTCPQRGFDPGTSRAEDHRDIAVDKGNLTPVHYGYCRLPTSPLCWLRSTGCSSSPHQDELSEHVQPNVGCS